MTPSCFFRPIKHYIKCRSHELNQMEVLHTFIKFLQAVKHSIGVVIGVQACLQGEGGNGLPIDPHSANKVAQVAKVPGWHLANIVQSH